VNTTAVVIGVAYLVTVVLGSLLALALARSATRSAHVDHDKLARRENAWLVVVVLLLLGLLLSTIWLTPYGKNPAAAAGGRVVNVTAAQFAWTLQPSRVPAGEPLEFRIRAADVNHGFGLYDPDDKLVFQVQAVPGALQKEYATLSKPGVYRIICLEFCGVGHHLMLNRLVVTAP
jgi:cytochrome c oxidase subunit II